MAQTIEPLPLLSFLLLLPLPRGVQAKDAVPECVAKNWAHFLAKFRAPTVGAQFVARNRAQKMGLFPCVFFGPECQRARARYSDLSSGRGSCRNAQEAPRGHRRPRAPRCFRKLREAPSGPKRPQPFSSMFPGAPRTAPETPSKLPESLLMPRDQARKLHEVPHGSASPKTPWRDRVAPSVPANRFEHPTSYQAPAGARAQPCLTEAGFSRSGGTLDLIGARPQ